MKGLHVVSWILVVIGGLNWLLVGLFQNEIGGWILGGMDSVISRIVYILVGLSALLVLFTHKRDCKMCDSSSQPTM